MMSGRLLGRMGCVLAGLALVASACGQGEPQVAPELQTTLAEVAAADDLVPTTTTVPVVVEEDTDPNTLYVSPEVGRDENSGQTPDDPWKSLQVALDALQPGQTLYLMDGTYVGDTLPGEAHFVVRVNGTETDWLRISAAPGHSPEIIATSSNGISIRGDYVEISNLRVRGEGFSEENSYGWGMLDPRVSPCPAVGQHHLRHGCRWASARSSRRTSRSSTTRSSTTRSGAPSRAVGSRSGTRSTPASARPKMAITTASSETPSTATKTRCIPDSARSRSITDGNGIIIDQAEETGYTGAL